MKRLTSFFCLLILAVYHVSPVLAEENFVSTTPDNSPDFTAPGMSGELNGPIIRVLISTVKGESGAVLATSTVLLVDNQSLNLDSGIVFKVKRNKANLSVVVDGEVVATGTVVRLVPDDNSQITELKGVSRPLKGHKSIYNRYRGTIEWRVSKVAQSELVINELPLEEYLWGTNETSPGNPSEFVKALIVAARSYAYVRLARQEPYTIVATTADQLYLGSDVELRMPGVRLAAEATRGQIITYNGVPVTTPYFSHTNGKTLDWDSKHKDSRPWLKPVAAIYDKGKRQSGHGYGMSLNDAQLRAKKDAWQYGDLLKYYYSGVQIEQKY